MAKMGLVVRHLDCSRPIKIDPRSRAVPANRNQPKRSGRFRWRPPLERIVQRLRDEGAHADALRGRLTTHLHREPVFKRNGRSHYAEHNSIASVHRQRGRAGGPVRRAGGPPSRGQDRRPNSATRSTRARTASGSSRDGTAARPVSDILRHVFFRMSITFGSSCFTAKSAR